MISGKYLNKIFIKQQPKQNINYSGRSVILLYTLTVTLLCRINDIQYAKNNNVNIILWYAKIFPCMISDSIFLSTNGSENMEGPGGSMS
jgi:hypothetical protein